MRVHLRLDLMRRAMPWLLPILAAFGLRLLAWKLLPYQLPNEVPISDEAEYRAAAIWLAGGRGFSFFKDWIWTRPPLYVLFLAAHIKLWGPAELFPIRLSQAILSTATVGLCMVWARQLAPPAFMRRVALGVGWLMAFSYSFAGYSFFLLSETLFMFFLFAAFVALTFWAQRRRMGWLISGAILLGCGALTRALLAGVLPLIAGWVWWTASQQRGVAAEGRPRRPRPIVAPLLLTIVVSAIILPWSIYNTRFYGAKQLILIDTTGGYNAMYGAQAAKLASDAELGCIADPANCGPVPSRDEQKIRAALITEPDHSLRQAQAYRTAWAWFAENPAGFIQKTGRELIDLLLINYGGAERLYKGYSSGATPLSHQAGLLLDDLVYLVTAPLAVLGIAKRQGRPGKGLAIIWLSYNLVTGPLFFAINRFRLPLLPVIWIYALCAVVEWRIPVRDFGARWLSRGLSATVAVLLLLSFVIGPKNIGLSDSKNDGMLPTVAKASYNRRLAGECVRAADALKQGQLTTAQAIVDRGSADEPLPCFALVQARIYQYLGDSERALALLHKAADQSPVHSNAQVLMVEGDIRRSRGELDAARGVFASRPVETFNDLAWAWEHLEPPITSTIDLGGALDLGIIDGFLGREYTDAVDWVGTGYRWTGPQARLRFVQAGTGQPQLLQLRVNGQRPDGEAPAVLTILQGERAVITQAVPPEWTTLSIPLGPSVPDKDVVVTLRSNIFVPSPIDPTTQAQVTPRLLGVQVDWATLAPAQP